MIRWLRNLVRRRPRAAPAPLTAVEQRVRDEIREDASRAVDDLEERLSRIEAAAALKLEPVADTKPRRPRPRPTT